MQRQNACLNDLRLMFPLASSPSGVGVPRSRKQQRFHDGHVVTIARKQQRRLPKVILLHEIGTFDEHARGCGRLTWQLTSVLSSINRLTVSSQPGGAPQTSDSSS